MIRLLGQDDLTLWKDIRRAALTDAPRAFGRTLASFEAQSDQEHLDRLANTRTFGAFDGGHIVGSASWQAFEGQTEAHRARVYSFFLRPDWRGCGVADALMETILADAQGSVLQLELDVAAENARAVGFYRRHGFILTGRTPRALRHGTDFIDEDHMLRRLDA